MQPTTESSTTASTRGKKKGKPNGQSNGKAGDEANGQVVPFPGTGPGEEEAQGADADQPEGYEPKEPSQNEVKLADDVFIELQNRAEELGIEKVVANLVAIIDVHPAFRTPVIFSAQGESEAYDVASNIAEVARFICRASSRIVINANHVVFYYRDHEKWTEAGQTVFAKGKKLDGLTRHHTEGTRAFITVNYHAWYRLNPLQKVFTLYRALRERDEEGSKRAPDYTGYFEEPGLFGAGVHEETCKIARAFVRDAPERVGDPHQLPLLAGIFDED